MEAGDGTTSVVVIAGALLKAAQDMLDTGLHPQAQRGGEARHGEQNDTGCIGIVELCIPERRDNGRVPVSPLLHECLESTT